MPKIKTHKSLKKRVRVTKGKKVLRTRAGKSHLMSGTASKTRRKLKRAKVVSKADTKRMHRLLGIG